MTVTVAIADDHRLLLEGLARLLADDDEIEVVGQADCGSSMRNIIVESQPDVAVCDVTMPDYGALEIAKSLGLMEAKTRLLALTVHEEPAIVKRVLGAGATGYILKKYAFDELVQAIKSVHAGECYVSPCLAVSLIQFDEQASQLSARELEILIGFGNGEAYKQIAARLGISAKTVETYRSRLMQKLDLQTTADLIKYAVRNGFVTE